MSRSTFPAYWKGKLFFNVSPSDPVNALAHSEVVFEGGEWPVDYAVDMPESVSFSLLKVCS